MKKSFPIFQDIIEAAVTVIGAVAVVSVIAIGFILFLRYKIVQSFMD